MSMTLEAARIAEEIALELRAAHSFAQDFATAREAMAALRSAHERLDQLHVLMREDIPEGRPQ